MKSKRAIFISCLAAMALLASPVFGDPRHSGGRGAMISGPHATTHVTRSYPRYGSSAYSGTRYYGSNWRHHRHHGGTQFFFYGGYPYGYYGYYPYYWDSPWGYDYYYPNSYGYYYNQPAYGYSRDTVVARVQQHLADQGYYNGTIDGVVGPRTRAAIRAYESTHGMAIDGIVSNRLLSRMGLR
jgi:hypothetical protein